MSAEDRRESVIAAALTEFARGGYEGTSTESIAQRVGVSQPYLFRLFPNKRAMFLAAALRCAERTRDTFVAAAEGIDPEAGTEGVKEALGDAYLDLIADGELVMMQMQMQVASHQAARAGDAEFGETIRAGWTDLVDTVRVLLSGDDTATGDFMAQGMLINVLVALGYPQDHRIWNCARS
ncbi:TetR family transcriptional regulator [Actinocorallia herbida]|uniref:TetR family transcriptional regulator n=2 Tax=Actinocorallia herbida TaxID=58109 RepID=A0A3N1D998_9ACTN|nr:TetR family transcriptional regulator [Actinocorallia herbida]